MKNWKCNYCHTEKKTGDKVIICICNVCCSSMVEIKQEVKDVRDN